MSDATARFNLDLNANAKGVDETAAAGQRLHKQIEADTKALRELEKQQRALQQGAKVDIETHRQVQGQIDAKKAAIASNTDAAVKAGVNLEEEGRKAKAAATAERERAKAAKAAAAEDKKTKAEAEAKAKAGAQEQEKAHAAAHSSLVQRSKASLQAVKAGVGEQIAAQKAAADATIGASLQASLVSGNAYAMIGAAVLAVVSVLFVAIAKLSEFALAAADAARSAGILREAATGSAAGAERLGGEVARLAARIATPRGEIEQLALALARSGLQGNVLETALSAVATTAAVMGQAAGGALQSIIERSRVAKRFLLTAMDLQGTGIALRDVGQAVAKRLGISVGAAMAALQNGQVKLADGVAALDDVVMMKFGPAAARQMLALPTQILKAKEALVSMFAGVKIEGFLQSLHGVLSLLDANSVSGRALKVVFEGLLNPLFDSVAGRGGLVRAFFQGIVIGVLIVAIQLQRLRNAWNEAFGGGTTSKILTVENAITAGKLALGAVVGVALALAGVLALVAIAIALIAAPFVLAGAAVYFVITGLVTGFQWLVAQAGVAYDAAAAKIGELKEAGKQAVVGFVNELVNGQGLVAQAGLALAKAALGGVAGGLIIKSPSRAMGQYARYTWKGFTNEIEDAEPKVSRAMASTFAAPAGAPGGALAAAGGGGGGGELHFHFGDIIIGGRRGAKDPALEAEIADLLRRAVQRAGLRS